MEGQGIVRESEGTEETKKPREGQLLDSDSTCPSGWPMRLSRESRPGDKINKCQTVPKNKNAVAWARRGEWSTITNTTLLGAAWNNRIMVFLLLTKLKHRQQDRPFKMQHVVD